jgi:hypothetical protein
MFPLYILMDVRKFPLEIIMIIKERPEEYKACHKEVMALYKAFRRGEIDVPEFTEGTLSIMQEHSVRPYTRVLQEEAQPRIARSRQTIRTNIIEELKNQLKTVNKTIEELLIHTTVKEIAEVKPTLMLSFETVLHSLIDVLPIFSDDNENLARLRQQFLDLSTYSERANRIRRARRERMNRINDRRSNRPAD